MVLRVAGFKGADTPFAKHHFVIAARHHVLGRKQQLLDGGRDAPLQQDGLAHLAQFAQQVEVLHVAGAHLQNVANTGPAAGSAPDSITSLTTSRPSRSAAARIISSPLSPNP